MSRRYGIGKPDQINGLCFTIHFGEKFTTFRYINSLKRFKVYARGAEQANYEKENSLYTESWFIGFIKEV